ncbi:MAG: hypothetical protein ACTSUR_02725 [Candidatus Heimdallarchaeaceae archaeon]
MVAKPAKLLIGPLLSLTLSIVLMIIILFLKFQPVLQAIFGSLAFLSISGTFIYGTFNMFRYAQID